MAPRVPIFQFLSDPYGEVIADAATLVLATIVRRPAFRASMRLWELSEPSWLAVWGLRGDRGQCLVNPGALFVQEIAGPEQCSLALLMHHLHALTQLGRHVFMCSSISA